MRRTAEDKTANYLTMLGHICSDINQGALLACLPFLLIAHPDFSYTALTVLIFAANISSALIQPLFGWIGDKRPTPWVMALGVFLAGLGMSLIGVLSSYGAIVFAAMLTGIGVAMFHPEGGRLANLSAGNRKENGMSIFAVGGNIGFFIGPILTAIFLSTFGMQGTVLFIIPAAACSIILLVFNRRFVNLGVKTKKLNSKSSKPDRWGRFSLVLGVLSLRSILQYGLMSFIPLFMMQILGQTEVHSSLAISLFSVFGALATALSGRTAEKFGTSRLMLICLAATTIFALVFAFSKSVPLALCATVLLAISVDLFYASTVAYGMNYVPNSLGMASGLSYGVAVSVGGVAEPLLGMVGDAHGLVLVILLLAAASAIALLIGIVIHRNDKKDTQLHSLGTDPQTKSFLSAQTD